ncbi:MAG: histidine kinase [Herbaspirillum sp.]|jgi:signal transduction histidine kinase|nr:histidine kinase [Herbaspirillum sp.]
MMHNFLSNNHDELIRRCREKVAQRPARKATEEQLQNGVPMFLDQLIRTLRIEKTASSMDSRKMSGMCGGRDSCLSEMGVSAAQHGRELLKLGFSVDQVVHDYGDLCEAITDLAYERDTPFEIDEFRTLNRCLDNAIADAVTEFSYQRDFAILDKQASAENERFGFFVHELRNYLGSASLAFSAAKVGNLNLSGATGAVLERSLNGLRDLITRSVEEVRTTAEHSVHAQIFSVAEFVAEVRAAADLTAVAYGGEFFVSDVDTTIAINGYRDLLFSAVGNLLQNAFKFTQPQTAVTLAAYAVADRIIIDVSDHCGGLHAGAAEKMFDPYTQVGMDKSGLGLGLSIARHSVELNGGTLSVHDLPGRGCIFTITLPRYALGPL